MSNQLSKLFGLLLQYVLAIRLWFITLFSTSQPDLERDGIHPSPAQSQPILYARVSTRAALIDERDAFQLSSTSPTICSDLGVFSPTPSPSRTHISAHSTHSEIYDAEDNEVLANLIMRLKTNQDSTTWPAPPSSHLAVTSTKRCTPRPSSRVLQAARNHRWSDTTASSLPSPQASLSDIACEPSMVQVNHVNEKHQPVPLFSSKSLGTIRTADSTIRLCSSRSDTDLMSKDLKSTSTRYAHPKLAMGFQRSIVLPSTDFTQFEGSPPSPSLGRARTQSLNLSAQQNILVDTQNSRFSCPELPRHGIIDTQPLVLVSTEVDASGDKGSPSQQLQKRTWVVDTSRSLRRPLSIQYNPFDIFKIPTSISRGSTSTSEARSVITSRSSTPSLQPLASGYSLERKSEAESRSMTASDSSSDVDGANVAYDGYSDHVQCDTDSALSLGKCSPIVVNQEASFNVTEYKAPPTTSMPLSIPEHLSSSDYLEEDKENSFVQASCSLPSYGRAINKSVAAHRSLQLQLRQFGSVNYEAEHNSEGRRPLSTIHEISISSDPESLSCEPRSPLFSTPSALSNSFQELSSFLPCLDSSSYPSQLPYLHATPSSSTYTIVAKSDSCFLDDDEFIASMSYTNFSDGLEERVKTLDSEWQRRVECDLSFGQLDATAVASVEKSGAMKRTSKAYCDADVEEPETEWFDVLSLEAYA